jgi:DNA-binding transcriptional ArsR family regulator
VPCGQLPLTVSKSTASHHFKVLREAGVVRADVDGTRRYYTLRRDDLEARFPGLLDTILDAQEPARARAAGARDRLHSP